MANSPTCLTWLPVVALALSDAEERILLQKRLPGKRHGGEWEFPGGKVENGENPRLALVREIGEELDITLDADNLRPAHFAEEAGDLPIVLFLYTARTWSGTPQGLEGQEWGWFSPEQAQALPLAPMDRDLLNRMLAS